MINVSKKVSMFLMLNIGSAIVFGIIYYFMYGQTNNLNLSGDTVTILDSIMFSLSIQTTTGPSSNSPFSNIEDIKFKILNCLQMLSIFIIVASLMID